MMTAKRRCNDTGAPLVMTGEQLCAWLGMAHDEKWLAALRHRMGLPSVEFRQGGKSHVRYLRDAVLTWLWRRQRNKESLRYGEDVT